MPTKVSKGRGKAAKKSSTTATRKTKPKVTKRRTTKPRSSAVLSRTTYAACPANRSIEYNGACGPVMPCLDSNGLVQPWLRRGPDGVCRLKPVGAGQVLDYKTNRPVSIKTPRGRALAAAKRSDDGYRFYDTYQKLITAKQASHPMFANEFKSYYDKFDHSATQDLTNRMLERQTTIEDRLKKREELLEKSRVPYAGDFYHTLNHQMAQLS